MTTGQPRGASPETVVDLGDAGRRRPVSVLLLVMVLVTTTVVAGAMALSFHWSSERATSDAHRDARFQARLAANGVETSLHNASASLVSASASPTLIYRLNAPSGCLLTAAALSAFQGSHLDLVRPDGSVACSSLPIDRRPPNPTHGHATWLADALRTNAPTVSATARDALTGRQSVAIVAPVHSGTTPVGALVAVIPVEGVADSLARTYASPRQFAFTVVEPAAGVIRSSSGVERAANRPIAHSGFATSHAGTWKAPDGAERLYESATIPTLGWRVFAGLDRGAVTAAARDEVGRQLLLAAVALLSLAAIALFVSRRIVRPLQSVTSAIVVAGETKTPAPVEVTGPREIAILAAEFNAMIDARLEYETRLSDRALHDDLTGLPNRVLLHDRLELALSRRAAHGESVAVLFLDLDRFKLVNDTYGHPIGDSLLRAVAGRLRDAVRAHDTLARFGGDEFVVVCEDAAGTAGAVQVAEHLADALEDPFVIGGTEINVSARVGITLASGSGVDGDELVREADIAMYQAKTSGRAWEIWDDDLRARSAHRLELAHDLRAAIERDELVVEYQPIFDLEAWCVVGAEALVRWNHPRLGRLAPGRFIPIAEESGQIAAVGEYVLRHACAFMGELNREGQDLSISVNAAVPQLHEDFPPMLTALLADTGLAPDHLWLEITESALVEAFGAGADALARLRAMGIHVAVDDFGTGYSSLSYLQHFPFDTLKVDRSFIEPLGGEDTRPAVLVQAILNMASAFSLHVVAEGVETPTQLAELHRLGCPFVQGFLLAEPMSADALRSLVRTQRPDRSSARDFAPGISQ